MSKKKTKLENLSSDEMDKLYDAPQTANIAPQKNRIANCSFKGGGGMANLKLNSGHGNTIENCVFSKVKIKATPEFKNSNDIKNLFYK